jgi:hypothetical protein
MKCPRGVSVELALRVCLTGLVLGLAIFTATLVSLVPLAASLVQRVAGYEVLVVLSTLAVVVAFGLLDFNVLLPAGRRRGRTSSSSSGTPVPDCPSPSAERVGTKSR